MGQDKKQIRSRDDENLSRRIILDEEPIMYQKVRTPSRVIALLTLIVITGLICGLVTLLLR
jgi:hypothetical protein